MKLEEKSGHANVLKGTELIGDLLGSTHHAGCCSAVCTNMADCVSVRPSHDRFPVNASDRFFIAEAMQPGVFFLRCCC